jgi:protein-tyrosine phosphatase
MPRPRGGDWLEDEVRAWKLAGVDLVVSLLVEIEIADFDLVNEETWCRKNGIEFLSFPIADRSVPASRKPAVELLSHLAEQLAHGRSIAIHCRQGIGRAGMFAASILILQGNDLETAIQRVSAARGRPVPETPEQELWLRQLAGTLASPSPR